MARKDRTPSVVPPASTEAPADNTNNPETTDMPTYSDDDLLALIDDTADTVKVVEGRFDYSNTISAETVENIFREGMAAIKVAKKAKGGLATYGAISQSDQVLADARANMTKAPKLGTLVPSRLPGQAYARDLMAHPRFVQLRKLTEAKRPGWTLQVQQINTSPVGQDLRLGIVRIKAEDGPSPVAVSRVPELVARVIKSLNVQVAEDADFEAKVAACIEAIPAEAELEAAAE